MIKNNIERQHINGEKGQRTALFEQASSDLVAQEILADVDGTVVDYYRFKDLDTKVLRSAVYSELGWESFEVGEWTVFHIRREDQSRLMNGETDE